VRTFPLADAGSGVESRLLRARIALVIARKTNGETENIDV